MFPAGNLLSGMNSFKHFLLLPLVPGTLKASSPLASHKVNLTVKVQGKIFFFFETVSEFIEAF